MSANIIGNYKINGSEVLTSTTLGSSVVNSSLTSVGTLTSLNVSGDIDSTTLKVDSVNNRVGINDASPDYSLDVTGSARFTEDLAVGGDIDLGDVDGTLQIDSVNKRLGVNKLSPNYTLDIGGDSNITGNYKISGSDVLTSTTLGSSVVNSSLTSVGTLTSLDVAGDINTDSKYQIGGTDVLSTNSGNVVLGGNNVYHPPIEDDLVCTVVPRGGTAPLGNVNSTGVYAYEFSASGTSEVSFILQLSHRWHEGTDVTPHFHWCPSSTNALNAVFKLDYWVVNIDGTIPAVTTLTQTVAAPGVAFKHTLTSFGAVSMTGKTASCLFGGRLYRDGGSASDTFTGIAYILSVDLHVKNNRLGYNT